MGRLRHEDACKVLLLLVALSQFSIVNAQTVQVINNGVSNMYNLSISPVSSPTANEQLSITNKGNATDYPVSIDPSHPFLTVTVRWSQNFNSTITRYDVRIVQSSTHLGAGVAANLPSGQYSRTFANAPMAVAGRPTWTLIARVNATDQAGLGHSDEYQWIVAVQGFTGTTTIPSGSITTVTAERSSTSSTASVPSVSTGGSNVSLWLLVAGVVVVVGWMLYRKKTRTRLSNSRDSSKAKGN